MLLVHDDTIECEETLHDFYQILATIVVCTVGIAMPCWFSYTLWKQSQANIKAADSLRTRELAAELQVPDKDVELVAEQIMMDEGYSFLTSAFKPSVIWWESVDMLRKLALVGLVLLLGPGSAGQLFVGLLLTVGFSALLVGVWPYKDKWDSAFKAATELHIFIAIAIATVMHSSTTETLDREMLPAGFYSHALVVSFAVLVPLAFIATVYQKLRETLRETKAEGHGSARVELEHCFKLQRLGCGAEEHRAILRRYLRGWHIEKRFACFLSHFKAEAGTDAALLHDLLLNAMPGCGVENVFLDSNNLDNLDNIPTFVRDSDCVILLLTKNVLTRPYVLLELYTATQAQVPIIILQLDGAGGYAGEAHKIESFLNSFPEYCKGDGKSCGDVLKTLGIEPTEMRDVLLRGLHIQEAPGWDTVRKHVHKADKWLDAIAGAKKVLAFSAHASDTIKQTQVAALTKALVAQACPENAILQALQDVARDEKTEIQLDADKTIVVIHDAQDDAQDQTDRLTAWLSENTDLDSKQLLTMGASSSPSQGSTMSREMDEATVRTISNIRSGSVVAVILLQNSSVLHDARCLAVLHAALTSEVKLVPIRLSFAEPEKQALHYQFAAQHALMADLGAGLSAPVKSALEKLALASVQEVSVALSSHVPNAISKTLEADPGAPERQTQLLDIARTLRMQFLAPAGPRPRPQSHASDEMQPPSARAARPAGHTPPPALSPLTRGHSDGSLPTTTSNRGRPVALARSRSREPQPEPGPSPAPLASPTRPRSGTPPKEERP